MLYVRPSIVTMLFVLTSLTGAGTSAHAEDGNENRNAVSECRLVNTGNNDNLSCGQMIVGANNATGSNNNVGGGQLGSPSPSPLSQKCIQIMNLTGVTINFLRAADYSGFTTTSPVSAYAAFNQQIAPGDVGGGCTKEPSNGTIVSYEFPNGDQVGVNVYSDSSGNPGQTSSVTTGSGSSSVTYGITNCSVSRPSTAFVTVNADPTVIRCANTPSGV